MRLYSYKVARDYGFAPNPFYGCCTLATCKPAIRLRAEVGDWIIGTGAVGAGNDGDLVFAMRVSETMTLDEYWEDPRFRDKRPNLRGSLKQAFGDNIYHRDDGQWDQANSHHSFHDGSPNPENVDHDTKADRVLVSEDFMYFGGNGPRIPDKFRELEDGSDFCAQSRGHRCNFPEGVENEFVEWLDSLGDGGFLGRPGGWPE